MQWLRKWLGHLIYLPNIMPLTALFKSEIFPWAFLYALRKDLRITFGYALFLVYIVFSAATHLNGLGSVLVSARALFALINASLIYYGIYILGRVHEVRYFYTKML